MCVSEVAVVVVVAFISRQRIREWQERGGLTQQHQNGVGVVAVVEKGRWCRMKDTFKLRKGRLGVLRNWKIKFRGW